jgi:hypothetical protein
LTKKINIFHKDIASVDSALHGFVADLDPIVSEPPEPGTKNEPTVEGLIERLASIREPPPQKKPGEDVLHFLARAVQGNVSLENRDRPVVSDLHSLYDQNAARIARRREALEPPASIESCDFASLLKGTELCDEINATLSSLRDQAYEAECQYTQLRISISQRRLAIADLANSRVNEQMRAAIQRLDAIERADWQRQNFRWLLGCKTDCLKYIAVQYNKFLSKGAAGAAPECEALGRVAAESLTRLIEWANEAAQRIGMRECVGAVSIPSSDLFATRRMMSAPVMPSVAPPLVAKKSLTQLADERFADTQRWQSSSLAAINGIALSARRPNQGK